MWILIRWIQPADQDLHCFIKGYTFSVNCSEEPAHCTVLTEAKSLPCSHTQKGKYNLAGAYIPCSHTHRRTVLPEPILLTHNIHRRTVLPELYRSHTHKRHKGVKSCFSLPCSHTHKDIQPTLFANTQTYSLARAYPVYTNV